MITSYNKNILDEISMPIVGFENGEIVWVNNRGKEILQINNLVELKEKNFLKYLDKSQVDDKSLRDVVSEIGAAFEGKIFKNGINLALKINGKRMEVLIKIVPIKAEFANSGIVIFSSFRRESDVLLRRKTERFYADMFKQVSSPIAICDTSNKMVEVNRAFCDLFGYSREETIDKYCYDLIAIPGEKSSLIKISERLHKEGIQNQRLELADKWGNVIEVNFTGHPIFENGKVIGTYKIYEDQKKENDIRYELTLQKTYFEGLFNTSTEALVLLTRDDRVVYFNDAFEKLFGYSLEEAKGKFINNLIAYGDKMDEANKISEKTFNSTQMSVKTIRYHKDGRPISVELTVNPVSKDNKLLGIYGVYKDLTESSRIKKDAEIQSQYFNKLFESSMDAMAFLDVEQNILDINKAFVDLFGYEVKECLGIDIDNLIVSNEYKDESFEWLNESLAEKPLTKETKRMRKDGEIIDVEASGHAIKIGGKVIGILASYRDISERNLMMKEIDEQRAYFKQLFDNSPEAIVIIDIDDKIIDVNKGFFKIFGYEKAEAIGKYINDLIAPYDLLTEAKSLSAEVIEGGVVKVESKRRSKTNQLIDVDILAYSIKLNKENVGGYAIYSDITEKKRAEKEIEFLAYRDSLTGLFNRRVFYDKLKEKIKHMGKDEKLAVCYIDLDGFKKVNDNMGHNTGDEMLCYVAKNIEESVDKEDVVARMGGDEFVIYTDFFGYEEIDAKMKAIIESFNSGLKIFDYNIKISLSIGLAIYPDHGLEVEEIIKKSDIAMYSSKKDGLSSYRIYTNEMEIKEII